MAKKILVVDDEEDYRLLLSRVLGKAGYAVVTAGSGAEGLARFAAERPDLVLLDANLPDADGFEVCRRLRAEPRGDTPILFCTVRSSLRRVREGLKSGGNDYVLKPLLVEDLLARVQAALRAR